MNSHALWYLTRGTGAISLVLLTGSVVLGIAGVSQLRIGRWPRFFTPALHRSISLWVLVLLVIHIATAVLDGYVTIRLADAVVPFGGTYRPLWLGFGALAFDMLLALVFTSVLRARLGYRGWRAVHWLAYACWPVALLHGLGTGTDASRTWMLAIAAACTAAVAVTTLMRLGLSNVAPRVRTTGVAATVIALIAIAIVSIQGPLAPGWARKAGTPPPAQATTTTTVRSTR